ncbi:MAG: anti-sigma factor [Planctomycetes bacterium]|nr:anti-sigma factor [Planctomycetota bacterium]MCB9905153.1 anti-sigma factor [Planctomycetota bacterium]
MRRPDLESMLRRELRGTTIAPRPALRRRILTALESAPDRPCTQEAERGDFGEPSPRRLPVWITGLAAGLLALVGLRASLVEPAVPVPQHELTVALGETLDGSASALESDLLAQADLLAEDARRAASILLERMPAAPWARKSDAR